MNLKTEEVIEDIFNAFEKSLLKRRSKAQVEKIIEKAKTKRHLVEKLANILIENNLELIVEKYVEAQFFALSYMKYLPQITHITSTTGLERYNKVKDFFVFVDRRQKNKKQRKQKSIKSITINKDLFISLKEINKMEEEDKRLFFNTLQGFNFCLVETTLFNPISKTCCACAFKLNCKKVLKNRFPPLFKWRFNLIKEQTFLRTIEKYNLF